MTDNTSSSSKNAKSKLKPFSIDSILSSSSANPSSSSVPSRQIAEVPPSIEERAQTNFLSLFHHHYHPSHAFVDPYFHSLGKLGKEKFEECWLTKNFLLPFHPVIDPLSQPPFHRFLQPLQTHPSTPTIFTITTIEVTMVNNNTRTVLWQPEDKLRFHAHHLRRLLLLTTLTLIMVTTITRENHKSCLLSLQLQVPKINQTIAVVKEGPVVIWEVVAEIIQCWKQLWTLKVIFLSLQMVIWWETMVKIQLAVKVNETLWMVFMGMERMVTAWTDQRQEWQPRKGREGFYFQKLKHLSLNEGSVNNDIFQLPNENIWQVSFD